MILLAVHHGLLSLAVLKPSNPEIMEGFRIMGPLLRTKNYVNLIIQRPLTIAVRVVHFQPMPDLPLLKPVSLLWLWKNHSP